VLTQLGVELAVAGHGVVAAAGRRRAGDASDASDAGVAHPFWGDPLRVRWELVQQPGYFGPAGRVTVEAVRRDPGTGAACGLRLRRARL
jgi:hypothetical protein